MRHTLVDGLPRSYGELPGLLLERDLRMHPRGRLFAKLLVFTDNKSLNRYWRHTLPHGQTLGRFCYGAVRALSIEWVKGHETVRRLESDRRYFAVCGLINGHMTMEIISHEAVHLAFAYEKRVQRNMFGIRAASFDEERICYPAGRMAAAINRELWEASLFREQERS